MRATSRVYRSVCVGLTAVLSMAALASARDARPDRARGMLTQAIAQSLKDGTLPMGPAEKAIARGDRPCTMHEEIEEMLAAPRPWLPPTPSDTTGTNAPAMGCYDPDFPPSPEVIAFMEAQLYQVLPQYNVNARWTTTASGATGATGEPITLLWSFVPDGLNITSNGVGEGAQLSTLFAQMDTKFSAVGGRATWISRITDCFNRWGQLTGINYVHVTFGGNDWDDGAAWGSAGSVGRRGDVRISMKSLDGAFGVLAYDTFPNDGDMVIDSNENWGGNSANSHRFLRNTVMHEHGHGLGFAHTCPINNSKLMEPNLSTSFDGPQQDDIRAGQRNYGDPNEPDNNAGQAVPFGSFGPLAIASIGTIPSPTVSNAALLSIDADGEQDWHRFTLTQPLLVTATLTPVGSSYLDLDQNNDGSCQTTGTTVNALAQANLRLQIIAANGLSTVVSQDVNAAGLGESITSVLTPAGNAYLRVTETSTQTQTQLYRISFSTSSTLGMTASNGTFTDKVRLNWSNIPNATYTVFRNTTNDRASAENITLTPVAAGTFTLDDTTAVPGQAYFYWVAATQFAGFAYDFAGPIAGSRAQPANISPTASAGGDQLINDVDGAGSKPVTLDGSASNDPDGSIVNYRWTKGAAVLADGASPTALVNLAVGVHVITLTVTDNVGATGADTLTVTVNARPIANAGPDQTVTDSDNSGAETVILNGSGSSDPDGTIATYAWTEGALTLASGPFANASVSLAVGVHTITLTVTDNNGLANADTVVVTVEAGTPPTCAADFNGDGVLDPDDLADFIGCFFSTPPCATGDFNHDGVIDPDDLADYIGAFFAGC